MNPIKKFMGGNRELECKQDPNTKELVCQSFRTGKDGTRQQLAMQRMEVGSDCSPIVTESREWEEGELDVLEKKITHKLVTECARNKPSDY